LSAAHLQGNFGFSSFHKLVCSPSPLRFLILPFIGGKGLVMIQVVCSYKDSIPLLFLGLDYMDSEKHMCF
jgi:hypothetical protein